MKVINFLNKIIEYSFYLIFFLVPLVFAGNTSELFEFNKMWVAFGLTIVIATAWLSKMTIEKRIFIKRTPLDIPILLFLASQTISTLFSLDMHVSLWGYYSRFNGGLFSTICYVLLYYAFVSNLSLKHVTKSLGVSLLTGFFVALWGFPSHFGKDPTCFAFRGTFDTSCWTFAFKPEIRIFSTLGQPAWLAAYLAFLLPLSMAFALKQIKTNGKFFLYFALSMFFYACLMFANTRAGNVAFFGADILFWAIVFIKKVFPLRLYARHFLFFHIGFFVVSFFTFMPFQFLSPLQFNSLSQRFTHSAPQPTLPPAPTAASPSTPAQATNTTAPGITDSGVIRLLVWRGALDAWRSNPIFGTGVETFAYAYYKHRPPEHNKTSEWDYLYNKAHNEYLNYLTTTGIFGLGSYLFFLALFIFLFLRHFIAHLRTHDTAHLSHSHMSASQQHSLFAFALFSGWATILVTNFFGFSVVIMNIYLFLTPLFVLYLLNRLHSDKVFAIPHSASEKTSYHISPYKWVAIIIYTIIAFFMLYRLMQYWRADVAYALGSNLDRIENYQQAFPELQKAVTIEKNEPVYLDEFAINLGTLAAALYAQKDRTNGDAFAQQAIALNNRVVQEHPNSVVYWKNRVRLFYTLAQADPQNQGAYLQEALRAIVKASELAPTDGKIMYNLGVLAGQNGNTDRAIEILSNVVQLKPDYKDAYIALGIFYHDKAVDRNTNKVTDTTMHQKATATYEHILKNIDPKDQSVQNTLKTWQAEK